MKFCTKCGAELVDEAVICTKCGRMTEPIIAETAISNTYSSSNFQSDDRKPSIQLMVFGFAFKLFSAFVLFFLMLGIGYGYISSSSSKSYYYFRPESDLIGVAIFFSLISFAFSIVCFIMTLVEKHRGERLFSGIIKPILATLLFLASIILINA